MLLLALHPGWPDATAVYVGSRKQRYAEPQPCARFGYTGQRDLDDMGLMDYKARFYEPTIGRFVQPDSIISGLNGKGITDLVVDYHENMLLNQLNELNTMKGVDRARRRAAESYSAGLSSQVLNRLAYTLNNPIRYADPSGHCIWDLCIAEGLGLIELLLIAGAVTAVYTVTAAPGAEARRDAIADGIDRGISKTRDSLAKPMRGEYIPPGLADPQRDAYREALHRYKDIWYLPPEYDVPRDILDNIAHSIKKGKKPIDAAEEAPGPPEGDPEGDTGYPLNLGSPVRRA